jgi:transcriptional regulator with XRE-family HTH domain
MVMIGERLAEIRKDYGDTQATLASRLNVSLSSVRSWEQEKSSPPHEMLVTICKLYRVSADYLLGLTGVDPAYNQRKRLESFTGAELEELKNFENYLLWKRGK